MFLFSAMSKRHMAKVHEKISELIRHNASLQLEILELIRFLFPEQKITKQEQMNCCNQNFRKFKIKLTL